MGKGLHVGPAMITIDIRRFGFVSRSPKKIKVLAQVRDLLESTILARTFNRQLI
jgi:hypothetical protein